MRAITKAEVATSLPDLLEEAKSQPLVIEEQNRALGVLISMEDYGLIRKARAEKFLAMCDEMGKEIKRRADEDGVSLDELEKYLDRKAT